MEVFAIRATSFWESEQFPYDLAFDANDFQATHVLGYLGKEPIGAMRIRWFRDFAKIERTGFRPSHRGLAVIKPVHDFALAHIARKGYRQAITHAAPLYAKLWRMHFGWKPVNKPPASYEGETYVELVHSLNVPLNAITVESSVEVLFRSEGYWDAPGKYEAAE